MYRQSRVESIILDKRLVNGKMQYLTEVKELDAIAWVRFIDCYCRIMA